MCAEFESFKHEGGTACLPMLRPLFIDMAQFLQPNVARFMSLIELGHSVHVLPLFALSILWCMVAQRLVFAVQTMPLLFLQYHHTLQLL